MCGLSCPEHLCKIAHTALGTAGGSHLNKNSWFRLEHHHAAESNLQKDSAGTQKEEK